jgi:hypothetical protein
MTSELTPQITELFSRITEEQDPKKFHKLVEELNKLFDKQEQTLRDRAAADYPPL